MTEGIDLEEHMSGQMAVDLENMRDENLRLLQEISKIRAELQSERQEKELMLEAVFGEAHVDADMDETGLSSCHRTTSVHEIKSRAEEPKVQMRVLQVQRKALEERLEELEMNEQAQEDRWQWLDKYHTWLRSLPIQGEPNGDAAGLEDVEGVTLYERLCMMETSVVMQSQELKRTKQLFLRDKALLQRKLEEMSRRHNTMIRLKTPDTPVSGGDPNDKYQLIANPICVVILAWCLP